MFKQQTFELQIKGMWSLLELSETDSRQH